MHSLTLLALAATAFAQKRPVTTVTYDLLKRNWDYASNAYLPGCKEILGNEVTLQLSDAFTDTQAFVALDTEAEAVIATFRGTTSSRDFEIDYDIAATVYDLEGVTGCEGCLVHHGFQSSYQTIQTEIVNEVRRLSEANPTYKIWSIGHSLGGALSAHGYAQFKSVFPDKKVTGFSYGQPQTGDLNWAKFVDGLSEDKVGGDFYRVTHADDGVPNLLNGIYYHLLNEYWQTDPPSVSNTFECTGRNDSECNTGAGGLGINTPHVIYFGEFYGSGTADTCVTGAVTSTLTGTCTPVAVTSGSASTTCGTLTTADVSASGSGSVSASATDGGSGSATPTTTASATAAPASSGSAKSSVKKITSSAGASSSKVPASSSSSAKPTTASPPPEVSPSVTGTPNAAAAFHGAGKALVALSLVAAGLII